MAIMEYANNDGLGFTSHVSCNLDTRIGQYACQCWMYLFFSLLSVRIPCLILVDIMMWCLIFVVCLQSYLRSRSCCRRLWTRPTDSATTCRARAAVWRTGSSACWGSLVLTSLTALPSIPSRRFFCTSCPVRILFVTQFVFFFFYLVICQFCL